MSIQLLADADFNQYIVKGLRRREPSVKIWDAHQGKVIGLRDPQVLAVAAASGRVLISHDRKTMPGHFAEFIRTSESPGVILVKQTLDIGPAIDQIILMWAVMDPEEFRNVISYVPLPKFS